MILPFIIVDKHIFSGLKMLFPLHFQATPKDKKAGLVIHGLVDEVAVT